MNNQLLAEGDDMQIARLKIDFDGKKLSNDLQLFPCSEARELNELAFAFFYYLQDIKVSNTNIDDRTIRSSLTIVFSSKGDRQEINFCDRYSQSDADVKTLPDAIAQTLLDKFKSLEIDLDAYKPAFNHYMAQFAADKNLKNLTAY